VAENGAKADVMNTWRKMALRCLDLEAFPVDNGGSRLVILLFGDPHLLEGGQRGQNGATNPDRILPTTGRDVSVTFSVHKHVKFSNSDFACQKVILNVKK
jgi:hypothetical protein